MNTIVLSIEGMTCGHCIASVRKALSSVPDVQVASVTLGAAVVEVPSDRSNRIAAAAVGAVTAAGYPATVSTGPNAAPSAAVDAAMEATCCAPAPDVHTLTRTRA